MIPTGLELRKDFIIMHIVFMTNVFSCVGVNSWNFLFFVSLYGSRLVKYNTTFLVCGSRGSNRDGFNKERLRGCSTLFL